MGTTGCPSEAECGDIQLLPAPLHRHHLHYPREAQSSLLHDEPDRAVHSSCRIDRVLILLASRVRRADGPRDNNSAGSDGLHDGVYG